MKIILGADAIRPPVTGVARYAMELARQLPGLPDVQSVRFFAGGCLLASIDGLLEAPRLSPSLRRWLLRQRPVVKAYQWLSPLRQRYALRGLEDHLYHGPNFYLPWFSGRSIVTLHDLSVYTWSDCHPPERVRYMRSEIEKSLRRAQMLITDSEFNRREIMDYFSWPAERIVAVPLAAGQEYYPRSRQDVLPTLARFGLEHRGYALFVGTIEPRKNLAVLLDAYESMPMAERMRIPLVVAGYRGWLSEDVHQRLERAGRQGWLRHLGYVAEEHMPLLFAGARVFLFPSHYEGFGLPVLEAMACGTPVIASSAASIPEAGGDAAMYVAPEDTASWQQHIRLLMEDNARAEAMSKAGLAHAARFSWRQTALQTADVYKRALAL